jgi:hypothetical protein
MPPTSTQDISKKIVDFERILKEMKSQTELAINYDDLARFTRIYNKMQGIIDLNRILPKNKSVQVIRSQSQNFSPRESLRRIIELGDPPTPPVPDSLRLTEDNFYDLKDNATIDFTQHIETVRAITQDILQRFLKLRKLKLGVVNSQFAPRVPHYLVDNFGKHIFGSNNMIFILEDQTTKNFTCYGKGIQNIEFSDSELANMKTFLSKIKKSGEILDVSKDSHQISTKLFKFSPSEKDTDPQTDANSKENHEKKIVYLYKNPEPVENTDTKFYTLQICTSQDSLLAMLAAGCSGPDSKIFFQKIFGNPLLKNHVRCNR